MKNVSLILLTIICSVKFNYAQVEINKITLDDIFKTSTFRSNSLGRIHAMHDGEQYLQKAGDSLNLYDFKSGNYKRTLLCSKDLIPDGDSLAIQDYGFSLSKDETKVLISTKSERIYRHSSKSENYIFELGSKSLKPLSQNGKQQLASFSPDASRVVFVRENNIYIVDLVNHQERQITADGEMNKIINGAPDWVYEEEFSFAKGFEWSPDSKKLAYYKFDESGVKEFQMTLWGSLYPELQSFKYPKAGEDNSRVSIHIYDIQSKLHTTMDMGDTMDLYIPRIKWTQDPNILSIQRLNRHQNNLEILLADATTGRSTPVYQEINKYYVDITDDLYFLEDGEHFLLTSEQDGFNHIYLFDLLGNLEQQITKGPFDVTDFLGLDEKKEIVYFISSETSPLNRQLYSIKLDGTGKTLLSHPSGTSVVRFSNNFKYFIDSHSDANSPNSVSVYNSKGKELREVIDNNKLIQKTQEYNFSKKEFFRFHTPDQVMLNGWMIKPPDFDSTKTYPVLMYVYGGPGSQTVRNSWGGGNAWYQYLAQKGLIIVSVDNRGTGGRGEEFKKMTYLQLGHYETIDQIEAARYLGNLPYVDKERIGIWGWSYGGFMAASCMTQGAGTFSMGIAVAPVTDWRYYDNIYTERFMRTPLENPDGYDANSPVQHVDNLQGDLLIVHGTADDNVHYQNTVALVSALVEANKQFDVRFYPNSNHGIYTGQNTTFHLYSLLTEYIIEHLIEKDH